LYQTSLDLAGGAYETSGLINLGVEEALVKTIEDDSMPVVLEIARSPI